MEKNETRGRPDLVWRQFPDGSIKLRTRVIPAIDPEDTPTVVLEGDSTTLEYLGRLILAQALYEDDCGFDMSPKGAGNDLFDLESEVGIHIHRLPCLDGFDPTA